MIAAAGAWLAGQAHAQSAAPVTITPHSLAPVAPGDGFRVELPEAGALQPPAGADGLAVTLAEVRMDGGFPTLQPQATALLDQLRGKPVTLAEIYAAASRLEALYARAGHVLARVSIPPQELRPGGTLHIVVVDGFVEAVDVSRLPSRVREPVRRETAALVGKRGIRIGEIEQALVVAAQTPGLALRSTLARGRQAGGTQLLLEGSHRPISAELGVDNSYDRSLGRWSIHLELAGNSLLGQGETIYGFIATNPDLGRTFSADNPARVLGGGLVLPVGDGRLTVNPELTWSRTRPEPAPGAPQTVGTLRRLSLRTAYLLARNRARSLRASLAIEQLDEANDAPDFAVRLNHDRYTVVRAGVDWAAFRPSGADWSASLRLSQGLAGLGSLSLAEALAEGIPFSRDGARPGFTSVQWQGHAGLPWRDLADIAFQARAQGSFGRALFRTEQFALEGADGLSAWVGGVTTVDEGVVLRGELVARKPALGPKRGLHPYVFGAVGSGRIDRPALGEPDGFTLAAAGAGLRADLARPGLHLALEYARGFASYRPLDRADRLSFSLNLHV